MKLLIRSLQIKVRSPPKLDNYIMLFDAEGAGTKNADVSLFKKIGPVLGNYFPESLFRLFIVRTGFLISTVFSAIEGFLHERTRAKV